LRPIALLSFVLLLTSCASLQIANDFQLGRQALLRGNDESALAYFQSVAQRDPNYAYGTAYRQGVLSYLGRTEYSTGKLPQARQTLERAVAAKQYEDDLARLYLGLTLVRAGDRERGLKEIASGMTGIRNWLDTVNAELRFSYGQFWDPARDIRSAIQTQLAMISGRQEVADMPTIIAGSEWLGMRMEEEVDRARDQETRDRSRQNGDGGSSASQP
jgi:tetratricopeptide (TPR) repeat protein